MELNELLNKLSCIKPGAYVSIIKSKDLGKGVTKITRMSPRLGCDYSKLKRVIERDALVGRDLNDGQSQRKLKWGKWFILKYIIEYKGQYYLRISEKYNLRAHPVSQYYLNGSPVEKSDLAGIIAPSKLKTSMSDAYNFKINDIIYLEQNHKNETGYVNKYIQSHIEKLRKESELK